MRCTRTADGVDMKGKADVLIRTNEFMITDLKTTASSTSFSKLRKHYDLSAVYTLVTASSLADHVSRLPIVWLVRCTIPRAILHDCWHRLC